MARDSEIKAAPIPATAYSYIRLSSKRQANAEDKQRYRDGFRRQVQLREEYLAKNPHLTLDTTLSLQDIGVSAFTMANVAPGGGGKLALFQKAVDEGRVAKGSYLLVESLDRIARTEVNFAQHLLLGLINSGILVVTLTDGLTYGADDDDGRRDANFLFSVMTLMRAHEESKMKSKRLRATWEEKRRKLDKTKLTAKVPGWLKLVDGEFVPDDERVAIVNEIMELLADGLGRDRIARILNQHPEKKCWGGGRQWHGGTIQKITDSRALIGEFQPHHLVPEERNGVRVGRRTPIGEPIANYFPRVVSESLWVRARAAADKRRMKRAPNAGGRQGTRCTNLFGMVATCGVCTKPMNYRDRGPRSTPVLRCSGERAGTCTNAYRIPYEDTENVILSWLVKVDISDGAPGELGRMQETLRTTIAQRDELKVRGEAIVRKFRDFMEFAVGPLAEIKEERDALDVTISNLQARINTLQAAGGRDEREMAVALLHRLRREGASDDHLFRVRSAIRQILRDTVEGMWCQPDGVVEIFTIDKGYHVFRDGYWWDPSELAWIPWAGAFFGGGYRATRKELARRGQWLAEANDAWRRMHEGEGKGREE